MKTRNDGLTAAAGEKQATAETQHDAPPTPAPTAAELGLMQGFPVPQDKRVTRDNFVIYPYSRWAFQNIRSLQPTRGIFRGVDPVADIAADPVDLDALTFTVANGRQVPLGTWFDESGTDSFLVLHKGKLVYERYFNGMERLSLHQMFSVTKSFVGILTLCLIDEGAIEPDKQVQEYLPELRGSAFGDATVQQVLDMTNSLEFSEDYTDPNAGIRAYSYIFGNITAPPDYQGTKSIFEYLSTLRPAKREHGEAFAYLTPNTELLGWLISRVSGKSVAQQVEQRIWQRLGVERDGYIWINALGEEMAGGGLNMTAADAARFGQMILQNGKFNGQQVIPASVAQKILQPGDPTPFNRMYQEPWFEQIGYAYHDQWWTFATAHKPVSATGVFGQLIYIDAVAEVVIVKQSSHPQAESDANETDGPLIWHAIAEHLMQRP
jgi:CubicO group peptidase (beta-lactamase class C family)